MSETTQHTEWLNLIDRTGPFLSPLVLDGAFPQGLEKVETALRKRLRDAYGEWREAVENADNELPELHRAWIQLVLEELLEYDDEILLSGDSVSESLSYTAPEHGTTIHPDMVLDTNSQVRMLVTILEPDTDPNTVVRGETWPASPVERMTLLCRATEVSLGLLTDGERWMLVFAPKDGPAEYGTWYAHYWRREPITLQAFVSLLGVRKFFGPEAVWPETLLDKSLEYQDEVTETLGEQVRRAVEMLVQALDRADIERNRELLRDVRPAELYEAGLTVMMRLVFLLCAEERGLLLLGDETYDRHYAISTLRAQLGEDASRVGLEVLERRHDAWSRLLATFRGIYGGISHEALRLPALGGSLFDPDRFPFLEGREVGSSWKETSAFPLPINNRTVLALLRALQVLERRGGAQTLSYKALDVEQIGYVYEGLLEQTVARVPEATLGLVGSQKAKRSDAPLSVLEQARAKGESALVDLLEDITARSKPALTKLLAKEIDEELAGKILFACGGDGDLANRVRPFAHLLRTDLWGAPLVYHKDAFAVTFGTDRRESGSHYTPKVLTEKIVAETLEPVAYVGPAEGYAREEWRLKSPAELLELKICDPAMGSGAFLVQVCRWLGQRLVEAWGQLEGEGKALTVDGEVLDRLEGVEPMPDNAEERLLTARRLIAELCLYGVDLNPLAVELAKLSIWLVTMAKGRPFGFLDHNLRQGDSLLGMQNLEQLYSFDLQPKEGRIARNLFAQRIEQNVKEAMSLRKKLREIPIRDIRDVQYMERLDSEARKKVEKIEHIADAMFGEALASGSNAKGLATTLDNLSTWAGEYVNGDNETGKKIIAKARQALSIDLPKGKLPRKPFHWALEFPEVFESEGFDGIVGNPPFMGGLKLFSQFGEAYRDYLFLKISNGVTGTRGAADLCAFFFLRAENLIRRGFVGFLATNSIAQGDTRAVSLDQLVKKITIYRAISSQPWPGAASLDVSVVHFTNKTWDGNCFLDNVLVHKISSHLSPVAEILKEPFKLHSNLEMAFQGSNVCGNGFVVESEKANELIEKNKENKSVLFPYLNGRDFNSKDYQSNNRWIVNFFNWPLKRDVQKVSWKNATSKQRKEFLQSGIVPEDFPYHVASDFPQCLEIIELNVKPEREKLKPINNFNKTSARLWWQYGGPRFTLYEKISQIDRTLVTAAVSGANAVSWMPTNIVFDKQLVCFADSRDGFFALMQSSFHWVWARQYSSSMGGASNLRYTPTACFQTFAFPIFTNEMEVIGKKYHEVRKCIMEANNEGLTTLYNRFHNPDESSEEIQSLRDLHAVMDNAVAAAYGWDDLDLGHGFHETKQGTRFTISEDVQCDVLQRLLKLNHERYEEEFKQGVHSQKGTKKKSSASTKSTTDGVKKIRPNPKPSSTTNISTEPQMDLFSQVEKNETRITANGEYWLDGAVDKVLEWLEDHDGWHLKETVLQGSGIDPSQWGEAVTKLLKSECIQTRGTGDGRRYRVNL